MEDNTYLAPAAYQAFQQRDYPKAKELFTQRVEELARLDDKELETFLLKNDLAVTLIVSNQSDEAIDLLQSCLTYFQGNQNSVKVAMTLANLATAYEKKKEIKESIALYNQALANFPSIDDNDVKYFIHHNLSLLYMRRFQFNKAVIQRLHALEYKKYLTIYDKLIQFILRIVH